ncbi:SMI1/KNR4 family protein [Actinomycetospora lutea]|uniref:SMI1/KNR4 family protein n=1 Tax=Actinomycetospora lutea TaxID=663604 RepID=UPI002365A05F|nr:SMI1/KNR4 family protein [Actinomycetospora lutea]MDD7940186.1 SMI1/KNR4 family protein [Actinomycetospora lutea]
MIEDLWWRWVDRLEAQGWGARAMVRPPAGQDVIAAAGEVVGGFPDELAALYRLADGQVGSRHVDGLRTNLFPGHEFLPLAGARRAWQGWADIRATYTADDVDDVDDVDEMITVRGHDPVHRVYTRAPWWPLAEDGGGNHLMVDLDPPPGGTVGQVLVAGPDEDERRVLAPGIGAYLQALLAAELDDPDPAALADGVAWWDAPTLR